MEQVQLFACVECGGVFMRQLNRCPICEHGPENSQPTMKPVAPVPAANPNDALVVALEAARKFVRGRHSRLTYGPKTLLEQIDAALAAGKAESK